ncbi:MAG: DNA mismatch repair endonuclease MutL, partial [Methanocorpusculum sp.]|nr:DNA mismatch repair endonuclease MutL [Methanocorpusculum sp.]
ARSEGTTIVVEDLFYNTPARKKFQKSVATELSHVYDMVERIALAHRNVSIVLLYQGKERFRTYGTNAYADVIAAVFGTGFAKDMTEVSGSFGLAKVRGFITRPGCEMRSAPTRFYLTINSRQVVSRPLQWAVREGYGTLLPKGMYPAAFLDIEVDPRDVDVNVHPTKKEVRLSREREVVVSVKDAVYSALHSADIFSSEEDDEGEEAPDAPAVPPAAPEPVQASLIQDYALPDTVAEARIPYTGRPVQTYQHRQTEKQLRRTETADDAIPETAENIPEVLGQIGETYILARNAAGELLIIDQHAAHERVMYDRLLAKVEAKQAGQELLVPVTLTLSRSESAAMPELSETLARAGYVIEPFGRDVWAVRSVPVISSTLGDPQVIHEILAEAAGVTEKNPERVLDRVIKTAACRAVVKGNTELTFEQMRRLLRQLAATRSPYTCPHGRPTTIVLSKEKLAGMFLRT